MDKHEEGLVVGEYQEGLGPPLLGVIAGRHSNMTDSSSVRYNDRVGWLEQFRYWMYQGESSLPLDMIASFMDGLSFFGVASLSDWRFNKKPNDDSLLMIEGAEAFIITCVVFSYRRLAAYLLINKQAWLTGDQHNFTSTPMSARHSMSASLFAFRVLDVLLRMLEGYKVYLVTSVALDSLLPVLSQTVACISALLASCCWKNNADQQVMRLRTIKADIKRKRPFMLNGDVQGEYYFYLPSQREFSDEALRQEWVFPDVDVALDGVGRPLAMPARALAFLRSIFTVVGHRQCNARDVMQSLSVAACMIGFLGAMSEFSEFIIEVFSRKCFDHLMTLPGPTKTYVIESCSFMAYFLLNTLLCMWIKKNIVPIDSDFDGQSIQSAYFTSECIAFPLVLLESAATQTIPMLLALDMIFDVRSQDVSCHQWPENLSYVMVTLLTCVNCWRSWSSAPDSLRYYASLMACLRPLWVSEEDRYLLYVPDNFVVCESRDVAPQYGDYKCYIFSHDDTSDCPASTGSSNPWSRIQSESEAVTGVTDDVSDGLHYERLTVDALSGHNERQRQARHDGGVAPRYPSSF